MTKLPSVLLIGLPGSGKSVCGSQIAKRLGWSFLDTDEAIEKKSGLTIAQIFQGKGEAFFRQLEQALLDELVSKCMAEQKMGSTSNLVIATGGGMPVIPGNWEKLSKIGVTFFLDTDTKVLCKRLMNTSNRPLLTFQSNDASEHQNELMIRQLDHLLSERLTIYRQAQYRIDTSKLSPDQVAEGVVKLLRHAK